MSKNISFHNELNEDYAIFFRENMSCTHLHSLEHPFYEIILFTSGRNKYLIDGQTVMLTSHSILLIPCGVRHQPFPTVEDLSYYILWVNQLYMDSICTKKTDLKQAFTGEASPSFQLFDLDEFSYEKILSGFSTIYEAENSITFLGKDIVQRTLLQQLLVLINRVAANMKSYVSVNQSLSNSNILEEQVMLYISRHLQDDLTNQEIAEHFRFNKDYLNRRFKQYCGCSIHSFIIQKRLEYATQLIKRGVPLNELASKSGFNDYTNFYKLFQQTYGTTPREYKKKYTIF